MVTTETVQLRVADGTSMKAFVARPEGGRRPGLLLLQEIFGVNSHIRDVAQRLAQAGYVAVAPELFHRTAPPGAEFPYDDFRKGMPHRQAITPAMLAADLRAAYDFLALDRQTAGAPAGALGFCFGGQAAWVANAQLELKAAVAFYGSGIAPGLTALAKDQHGPMLLVWGGLDKHITPELRRQVDEALTAAKKPAATLCLHDADHGFFCDERPSYHPKAAAEAWALTLAFFAANLGD